MAKFVRGDIAAAIAEHVDLPCCGSIVIKAGPAGAMTRQERPAAHAELLRVRAKQDGDVGAVLFRQTLESHLVQPGESLGLIDLRFGDAHQTQVQVHLAVRKYGLRERDHVADAGAGLAAVQVPEAGAVQRQNIDCRVAGLRCCGAGIGAHQALIDIGHAVLVRVQEHIGVGGGDGEHGEGLILRNLHGFVGKHLAITVPDLKLQVLVAVR